MVALLPPVGDAVYQYLVSRMVANQPMDWHQVGMVALVAAVGAFVASTRPKAGREDISAQVNEIGPNRARAILSGHIAQTPHHPPMPTAPRSPKP